MALAIPPKLPIIDRCADLKTRFNQFPANEEWVAEQLATTIEELKPKSIDEKYAVFTLIEHAYYRFTPRIRAIFEEMLGEMPVNPKPSQQPWPPEITLLINANLRGLDSEAFSQTCKWTFKALDQERTFIRAYTYCQPFLVPRKILGVTTGGIVKHRKYTPCITVDEKFRTSFFAGSEDQLLQLLTKKHKLIISTHVFFLPNIKDERKELVRMNPDAVIFQKRAIPAEEEQQLRSEMESLFKINHPQGSRKAKAYHYLHQSYAQNIQPSITVLAKHLGMSREKFVNKLYEFLGNRVDLYYQAVHAKSKYDVRSFVIGKLMFQSEARLDRYVRTYLVLSFLNHHLNIDPKKEPSAAS